MRHRAGKQGLWSDDYVPAHAWLGDPGVGPVIGRRRPRPSGRLILTRLALGASLAAMMALVLLR